MTILHYVVFWLVVITFTVAGSLLSYSFIHFQRRSTDSSNPERGFRESPVLGLIWTLVPVSLLITLLVLTFQTIYLTQ
jgi:heme/copper-type cytochrome/quinol oxidase subunit 2